MSPRPQIDHIRRPQLLRAAADVIVERGLASTRIADVAERAGTSPPAVLYWFRSKDELLAEALTVDEERFYVEMRERIHLLERPRDQLRFMIEASAEESESTAGPCGSSFGPALFVIPRRDKLVSDWTTAGARRSPP